MEGVARSNLRVRSAAGSVGQTLKEKPTSREDVPANPKVSWPRRRAENLRAGTPKGRNGVEGRAEPVGRYASVAINTLKRTQTPREETSSR
jgi:hypothetical protein